MKKIVLISLALAAVLLVAGCKTSSGTAIPTGTTRRAATSPESVIMYSEFPEEYEELGVVRAITTANVYQMEKGYNRVLKELKEQAAKLGANGVVMEDPQHQILTYQGATSFTLEGTAIFVPR